MAALCPLAFFVVSLLPTMTASMEAGKGGISAKKSKLVNVFDTARGEGWISYPPLALATHMLATVTYNKIDGDIL